MASEIQIQVTNEANTPIVTVQDLREQIVLSVRKHGDAGPQTGDVELEPDMLKDFRQNYEYWKWETCVVDGRLYRAKYNFKSTETWNPDDWEIISTSTMTRDFQAYTWYDENTVVKWNGKLYRAKVPFKSDANWNPRDWDILEEKSLIADWRPNSHYEKDEVMIYNGKLYRAKATFDATNTWVHDDWL